MAEKNICPTCKGTGKCRACNGSGKLGGRQCQICDGAGKCPRCRGRKTNSLFNE